MPLFERARVEVYLPDLPRQNYQDLLVEIEREFTFTFGGCTIVRGLDGRFLSRVGQVIHDHVHLIYTDIHITFGGNFELLTEYAVRLRRVIDRALNEEAVLVVVFKVFHAG